MMDDNDELKKALVQIAHIRTYYDGGILRGEEAYAIQQHIAAQDKRIAELEAALFVRETENELAAPRRAHFIKIEAAGDTKESLLYLVREWLFEFETRAETINITSGGWSAGGFVFSIHDPDMTHDKYEKELEEFLKKRRTK